MLRVLLWTFALSRACDIADVVFDKDSSRIGALQKGVTVYKENDVIVEYCLQGRLIPESQMTADGIVCKKGSDGALSWVRQNGGCQKLCRSAVSSNSEVIKSDYSSSTASGLHVIDSTVTFSCADDHILVGAANATCNAQAKWDFESHRPRCKRVCPSLTVADGSVSYTADMAREGAVVWGTAALISCSAGQEPTLRRVHCTHLGVWSAEPTCVAASELKAKRKELRAQQRQSRLENAAQIKSEREARKAAVEAARLERVALRQAKKAAKKGLLDAVVKARNPSTP